MEETYFGQRQTTTKKNWLIAIGLILAVVLLGLIVKNKFFNKVGLGALQISTTPRSTVFIDGTQAGITNFFDDKIKTGEHLIKLVPEVAADNLVSWEGKVVLSSGISTVINRSLGVSDQTSSGEVLTMEKISSRDKGALAVISIPDQAMVKLDGEPQGFSPVLKEGLAPGSHQVAVSTTGYQERSISFKAVAGYKLIINVQLAKDMETGQEATASGEANTTPTPPAKPYVIIKETPTGWLRVRTEPSSTATEAAKVNPGETFPYLNEEKSGWLKIEYETDKAGWVSGVYVDLVK